MGNARATIPRDPVRRKAVVPKTLPTAISGVPRQAGRTSIRPSSSDRATATMTVPRKVSDRCIVAMAFCAATARNCAPTVMATSERPIVATNANLVLARVATPPLPGNRGGGHRRDDEDTQEVGQDPDREREQHAGQAEGRGGEKDDRSDADPRGNGAQALGGACNPRRRGFQIEAGCKEAKGERRHTGQEGPAAYGLHRAFHPADQQCDADTPQDQRDEPPHERSSAARTLDAKSSSASPHSLRASSATEREGAP